jgi:hypothetical protein
MDSLDSMQSSSSDEIIKAIRHFRVLRPEMRLGRSASLHHFVGRVLVSWLLERSSSDLCQPWLHAIHRSSLGFGLALSILRNFFTQPPLNFILEPTNGPYT